MASYKRNKPMRARLKKILRIALSLVLVVLGISIIFWSSRENFTLKYPRESESDRQVPQAEESVFQPSRLYIPQLNKTLAVSAGQYTDSRWVVSQSGVSFLTSSAMPGAGGNSVIYGHNRREILGNINKIKIGEEIHVVLENEGIVKYQVYEMKEIKPTQVEILNQTEENRLTIYTCSGYLDQARFVVLARQIS